MEQRAELNHAQIKVETLCNVKGGKMKKMLPSRLGKSLTKNQWMKGKIPAALVRDYQMNIKGEQPTQNIKKVNRRIRLLFLLSSCWILAGERLEKVEQNYISSQPTCLYRYINCIKSVWEKNVTAEKNWILYIPFLLDLNPLIFPQDNSGDLWGRWKVSNFGTGFVYCLWWYLRNNFLKYFHSQASTYEKLAAGALWDVTESSV